MSNSQTRALNNYRKRLKERGMSRFEVLGLERDRELIRSLARRLADKSPDSLRIRAAVGPLVSEEKPSKGNILKSLLRSPLAGADLKISRSAGTGRKIDI